jgi:hypothetical protein
LFQILKTNLLSEARTTILRESLLDYAKSMLEFYENVAAECYESADTESALTSLATYEIDVLKVYLKQSKNDIDIESQLRF